jgi:hypothetical protein
MSRRVKVIDYLTRSGDPVELFRDAETRTYRLFVNPDLGTAEFTSDELAALRDELTAIVVNDPWGRDALRQTLRKIARSE